MSTIEQRLYEAWINNRGVRLTKEEVDQLIYDDAIATRISNTAARTAGMPEPGSDCVVHMASWKEFQKLFEE